MNTVYELTALALARGCSKSLQHVLRSDGYLSRLQKYRNRPESVPGLAQAGVWALASLLNRDSESFLPKLLRSLPEVPGCDPAAMALVETLGDELISAAAGVLDDREQLLSGLWAQAQGGDELEIVGRISALFAGETVPTIDDHGKLYWIADIENQVAAGVLPQQFGPRRKQANCIGRAMCMLGAARLAGKQTYLAYPVYSAQRLVDELRVDFGQTMLEDFEAGRIAPDEESVLSIEELLAEFRRDQVNPERPHLACFVRLAGRRWYFVDCNFGLSTTFPSRRKFESVVQRLERYERLYPGLVLQMSDGGCSWRRVEKLEREFSHARALACVIQRLLDAGEVPAAFMLMTSSLSLENLVETMRLDPYDRARLRGWLRRSPLKDLSSSGVATKLPADVHERLSASLEVVEHASDESFPEGRLVDFEDSECLRVLAGGLRRLTSAIPMAATEFAERTLRTSDACHPLMEVGRTEFLLGCAVLSHLGVTEGGSEEVERFLGPLSSDQFRLLYTAGSRLRPESRIPDDMARLAERYLRRLPCRFGVSDRLLAKLRETEKM